MTRTLALVGLSLLLQSCIVLPDPWREEDFEEISQKNSDSAYDQRLEMFVVASGYVNDLHSPYGISTRFVSDISVVTSVVVNSFDVSFAGEELAGISLYNIESRSPIKLGSETVDAYPSSCCIFSIASSRFELEHRKGETMTVRLDYCLIFSGRRDCNIQERQFKAVVRRGLFTMVEV